MTDTASQPDSPTDVTVVATAYGGPEVLAVVPAETAAPGPGQVTVAVHAAAVNPIDYKLYGGRFGTDPAALPVRLGLEGAGVVTAVGDGPAGRAGAVAVGDEVIVAGPGVNGLYATTVNVPVSGILPKPDQLSWAQAAGLVLAGSTAVHCLVTVNVAAGDTLLVHGAAGSVGRALVQLAIARGARVIGTASPSRHDDLRGYGAEPVSYGEGLLDRVRALAPDGITAAVDTVGTDEAVDVSLALVTDRSRIATIVAFGRAEQDGFPALGGGPGADPGTEVRAAAWQELLPAAAAGRLDIPVARTYPLSQAADAHRFVRDGHAGGKVVLLTR